MIVWIGNIIYDREEADAKSTKFSYEPGKEPCFGSLACWQLVRVSFYVPLMLYLSTYFQCLHNSVNHLSET